MRILWASLCLAAWVALFAGSARSQDFDGLLNDYLAGYWKANPSSQATPAGVHSYDRQLEDLSPAAIEQEIRRNRDFLNRLEAWGKNDLSPDTRVDRDMLLDHIRLTLLELERMRSWKANPQLYVTLLGNAVLGPMKRPFAPPGVRCLAVVERLRQVPRFLTQARANLDNPPELYTRKALELIPATAGFVENGVLRACVEQGASRRLQARVRREALRAAASLRDFGRWLEKDLLPRSRGNFVLGPDLFRLKFRYYLGTELTPEQVLASAQADLKRTQSEMRQLAARLDPGKPVAQVLQGLSENHPRSEELASAYRNSLATVKDFVAKTGLVRLPQPDRLRVEPAPAFYTMTGALLDPPGPFEPDLPSFFYISTTGEFSDEAAEDFLRDNNTYAIPVVTIREAYPGHYVQRDAMNRAPWPARKVFGNTAFVEGWAHYTEQVMFEEGFTGCPQRGKDACATRLFQLQSALRSQLDAILDILLHTGGITPARAVKMLMEEGFQERNAAEKNVERAGLTSVQLSSYYTGKLEILNLREELRRRLGPAFVLREFHERLLSLGAPPVRAARELLIGLLSATVPPESGK